MQPPSLGPAGEVELGCRDVAAVPWEGWSVSCAICVGSGSLTGMGSLDGMAAPSPTSPFRTLLSRAPV